MRETCSASNLLTSNSVRHRPAHHRHRHHHHQQPSAHHAQRSSVPQQVIPRLRINAKQNRHHQHHRPRQQFRNPGIFPDHRKKLSWWLPRRYPPRQYWRHSRRQRKSQQLSREPAFHFRPRFFPYQIVPSQQRNRQRHPSVGRRLPVEPPPRAKHKPRMRRHRQPRQQHQPHHRITHQR